MPNSIAKNKNTIFLIINNETIIFFLLIHIVYFILKCHVLKNCKITLSLIFLFYVINNNFSYKMHLPC